MPGSTDQIIRFDRFAVDPDLRLLLCDGQPVPLKPKQFDVLLYFVRNPGRILTKEELLETLWSGQFVEEANLSQNVFWVRKALNRGEPEGGDRSYIVTLPGKGYQFNMPRPAAAASVATVEVATTRARSRSLLLPAIAALILIAAAVTLLVRHQRLVRERAANTADPAQPQSGIVLAHFQNDTDEPVLASALNTALRIGLEQSPRLAVVPDSKIAETLLFMRLSAASVITPALAEDICERRDAGTVVAGTIASVGTEYSIGLEATKCSAKKIVYARTIHVHDKDHIFTALDTILADLRLRLGESSDLVHQYNTPIEQATTPSLDAFKAFVAGNDLRQHGESTKAIPLYQHAIDLDPRFAMAYARLGACYATLSERTQAVDAYKRAYALSANVSQPEKFYIRSLYVHRVERNMFETIRVHDEWRTLYPQDTPSWVSESDALTQMGKLEDAIHVAEAGYSRDSGDGMMAMALARAYQRSGRFDDLQRIASDADSKHNESWDIHEMLWYRAVVVGDSKAADEERAWVKGRQEEYQALDDEAQLRLLQGRWKQSEQAWSDFEAAAKEQSMTGYADIDVGLYAGWLAELGLGDEATKILARWPAIKPTPEYARGLAAAGQARQAEAMMNAIKRDYPNDTLLNLWHTPIMEAEIALSRDGDEGAETALKALDAARPIGMRDYGVAYLRGKAYLRLRRAPDAEAEFQKIVDAPGLDPFSSLRPLALVGLARAQALQHKDGAAEIAYMAALDQWKSADADLPVLRQVKAEILRLKPLPATSSARQDKSGPAGDPLPQAVLRRSTRVENVN